MKQIGSLDFMDDVPFDQKEYDQLVASLKENEKLKTLFLRNHIPAEEFSLHPYKINRVAQSLALCENCRGLKACKQDQRGYCFSLEYADGVLTELLQPCKYQREYDKKTAHIKQYLVNDLGKQFEAVSFEEIKVEDESKEYIQVLKEAILATNEDRGLYLYGHMGIGKTYVAACACNEAARQKKKVAFVHMPSFQERIQSSLFTKEYEDELGLLKYAELVVFDDIGAENVTDSYRSILLSLLNTRMVEHKATWFTSNEDFETLENHYTSTSRGDNSKEAERIVERIRCLAKPVQLPYVKRRKYQDE